MTPLSAPLLATGSLPQSQGSQRERLAEAARQFEAIFVRQVLAEARKSHFGGGLFGEGSPDSAIGTFRAMQDENVADLAADRGAFGLAKMIEQQLALQLGLGPDQGASTGSARAGSDHKTSPVPAQAEPVEASSRTNEGSKS